MASVAQRTFAQMLDHCALKAAGGGAGALRLAPAPQRGRKVNRTWGEPSDQLYERHEASDFETKTQDKVGDKTTNAG